LKQKLAPILDQLFDDFAGVQGMKMYLNNHKEIPQNLAKKSS